MPLSNEPQEGGDRGVCGATKRRIERRASISSGYVRFDGSLGEVGLRHRKSEGCGYKMGRDEACTKARAQVQLSLRTPPAASSLANRLRALPTVCPIDPLPSLSSPSDGRQDIKLSSQGPLLARLAGHVSPARPLCSRPIEQLFCPSPSCNRPPPQPKSS